MSSAAIYGLYLNQSNAETDGYRAQGDNGYIQVPMLSSNSMGYLYTALVRYSTAGYSYVKFILNGQAGAWKRFAYTSDLPSKSSWNYDDRYVTALGTSGNNLTWTKNGTDNTITVPYATSAGSVAWGNITGKPSTFTPSDHNHDSSYLPRYEVWIEQTDDWGKTYAESHRQSLVYNTHGREWAYWIGMRSSGINYGTILRLSHDGLVQYAHKAGGGAGENWSAWKNIITSDNIGSQSVSYSSSAGSVAWSNVSGKPINLKAYSGTLASGGWKALQGNNSSPSIAISYNNSPAAWNSETYSSSLVWGCTDTRGLIDCGYNSPRVTFGGCYFDGSTDDSPTWYWKLKGTSGNEYDLDSRWSMVNHNHDSVYLKLTGGTLTGTLALNTAGIKFISNQYSGERWLCPYLGNSNDLSYYDGTSWQKVWHSGNDGSGSGLDADTLDGLHDFNFFRPWRCLKYYRSTCMKGTADGTWYTVFRATVDTTQNFGSIEIRGNFYYESNNDNNCHVEKYPFSLLFLISKTTSIQTTAKCKNTYGQYIKCVQISDYVWELQVKVPSSWDEMTFNYGYVTNSNSTVVNYPTTTESTAGTDVLWTNAGILPEDYANYAVTAGSAGSASSVSWSGVSSKPDTATRWPSWSEVTGKPSSFTPSSHNHDDKYAVWKRINQRFDTNIPGGIYSVYNSASVSDVPGDVGLINIPTYSGHGEHYFFQTQIYFGTNDNTPKIRWVKKVSANSDPEASNWVSCWHSDNLVRLTNSEIDAIIV